jgi:hypothetical protein
MGAAITVSESPKTGTSPHRQMQRISSGVGKRAQVCRWHGIRETAPVFHACALMRCEHGRSRCSPHCVVPFSLRRACGTPNRSHRAASLWSPFGIGLMLAARPQSNMPRCLIDSPGAPNPMLRQSMCSMRGETSDPGTCTHVAEHYQAGARAESAVPNGRLHRQLPCPSSRPTADPLRGIH